MIELAKFWKKLSYVGVRESMEISLRERIVLSNRISFLISLLGLKVTYVMFFLLNLNHAASLIILPLLFLVAIPFLNKKGFTSFSRISVCFIIPLIISLFALVWRAKQENQLEIISYFAFRMFIVSSVLLPFTLFDINNRRYTFSGVLWIAVCILTSDKFPFTLLKESYIVDLISISALIFLSGAFIFLQKINATNERRINSLLEDVTKTNKELQESKTALEESYEELRASTHELEVQKELIEYQNLKLQEKNREIQDVQELVEQKNTELAKYTHDLESQVGKRTSELSRANHELLNINKELDTFIYKASHDLMGPLSSLKGLQNIADAEITEEAGKKYLKLFGKQIDQMQHVLSSLIKLMTVKESTINLSNINLKELVNEVLKELENMDNFSKITFGVSIDEHMWFDSDRSLLHLILKNIISNSVQYSIALHQYENKIIISSAMKEGNVQINISDNGSGIKQEIGQKMFQMFNHGSAKTKGAGLGLYISKKAVEKLKGNISFKYDIDKNETNFKVDLPLYQK